MDIIIVMINTIIITNYSFGNSSHPQNGSVNQVNVLVPKDHGLALVLQILNK